MALRRITGATAVDGATITANGTLGGDPITDLLLTGTTATWSSAQMVPNVASKSILLTAAATANTAIIGLGPVTATADLAGEVYLYVTAQVGVVDFTAFRTSAGQNGGLRLDATGHLVITNAAGSQLHVFTNVMPQNAWVRVEAREHPDTATTGQIDFAYYLGHNANPVETWSSTTSSIGAAPTTMTYFRVGKISTTGTFTAYLALIADNAGLAGLIGPAYVPATAVANAGPDQASIEPFAAVPLDGSGSTGTGLTYAWRQISGPAIYGISSATAQKPTVSVRGGVAASTTVMGLTVTDSSSNVSAEDTVSIGVVAADRFYLSSAGAWTPRQLVVL